MPVKSVAQELGLSLKALLQDAHFFVNVFTRVHLKEPAYLKGLYAKALLSSLRSKADEP